MPSLFAALSDHKRIRGSGSGHIRPVAMANTSRIFCGSGVEYCLVRFVTYIVVAVFSAFLATEPSSGVTKTNTPKKHLKIPQRNRKILSSKVPSGVPKDSKFSCSCEKGALVVPSIFLDPTTQKCYQNISVAKCDSKVKKTQLCDLKKQRDWKRRPIDCPPRSSPSRSAK